MREDIEIRTRKDGKMSVEHVVSKKRIKYKGIVLFVHRPLGKVKGWNVSEKRSGFLMGTCAFETMDKAERTMKIRIDYYGVDKVEELVGKAVDEYGELNREVKV